MVGYLKLVQCDGHILLHLGVKARMELTQSERKPRTAGTMPPHRRFFKQGSVVSLDSSLVPIPQAAPIYMIKKHQRNGNADENPW